MPFHSFSAGKPDFNGIELDNNSSGSLAIPITHPELQYVSIIGTDVDKLSFSLIDN